MDSRQHRRVRMRLPVRLRWTAPVDQKIELRETIDVSRSRLLVSTKESHTPGVTVWVTFPYDASLSNGQPEILARVARCNEVLEVIRSTNAREKVQTESASEQKHSAKVDQLASALGISDAPPTFAVAFHLKERAHASSNGTATRHGTERRGSARRALDLPVHVHPERIPWLEEATTHELSDQSMPFRPHRQFHL